MKLKQNNKVNPLFQMSSLTDIIFLLLIFFMLTSTLVSPNAVEVNLPSANGQTIASQDVFVTINESDEFFVNESRVDRSNLEASLVDAMNNSGETDPTIVLRADKRTSHEAVIDVLKLGPKYDFKVILATAPE